MAKRAQLVEGPIGPILARLAVPMGLGIVFIIALNLADTYFVGQLGTDELAAMSFTFPVVTLVMSVVMGVGIGSTSALAREIGAGDEHAIRRLATHAIMLAFVIVVLVSGLGLLTQEATFRLLGAEPHILPLLSEYMTIWYLGAVFLVVPMIGMGSLRATGDTRTPMFIMMAAAIVNIALDPVFIFGAGFVPAMGLRGAAIATLIARSVTLVLALWVLRREDLLDVHVPTWAELRRSWWSILSVGLPAAVTNALAPVATAVLTWLIAREGTEAIAAYGVGSRVEGLLLIAPMALGAALTPFIGQNWGGHHLDRVGRAIVLARNFVVAWGIGAWILLALGGSVVAEVFTDDPKVVELVHIYLWIVPLSYGASGLVSVASASFNAVDKAVRSTVLSALRSLGLA
ncbi:MAG: MATE family efflux transporter, partial [Nannocystaceae bacterium]